MATREFESSYINLLAEAALVGLKNQINAAWIRKCQPQYELNTKETTLLEQFWSVIFNGQRRKQYTGTFEEFVEYRKTWKYYLAEKYTWWEEHLDDFRNTRKLINRIKQLSEENKNADVMTRVDDSEYNTLRVYARIESNG